MIGVSPKLLWNEMVIYEKVVMLAMGYDLNVTERGKEFIASLHKMIEDTKKKLGEELMVL
jgi:hypothetical protein